jgi:glucose/arabinose dehydrogenase
MARSTGSSRARRVGAAAALAAAAGLAAVAWGAATPAAPPRQGIADGKGGVELEQVGTFDRPVYVHQPPSGADGLLFVVEQPGRIKVVELASGAESVFLDIVGKVACCGERGLLSVAFAPDYATSGLFYVYYTASGGDMTVERFRRSEGDPLRADESSAHKLIEIEHSRFPNHNGGQLQFGPDGYLYIGTGDGGGAGDPRESAQNRGRLLGKLLRIDPSGGDPYSIPDGNPYVGRKGSDEIYALGLRNPWRFSFDRATGNIAIGDVGQDRREEIDYETPQSLRGANFGWDAFEGFGRFKSPDASKPPRKSEKPIEDYRTGGANCAITGGYVVRDPELPTLFGHYLYADHCAGELRSLIPEVGGGHDDRALGLSEPTISSFGEDAAGHVYVASLSSGRVSRLVAG